MYKDLDYLFQNLSKSKFRSSFHLRKYMIDYINEKGLVKIREHAYDFINKKIRPAYPKNDGRQTAMRGHPVFIAQHATGTCCRGCLEKWHHIKKGHQLTEQEQEYIVNIIMTWIQKEMKNHSESLE